MNLVHPPLLGFLALFALFVFYVFKAFATCIRVHEALNSVKNPSKPFKIVVKIIEAGFFKNRYIFLKYGRGKTPLLPIHEPTAGYRKFKERYSGFRVVVFYMAPGPTFISIPGDNRDDPILISDDEDGHTASNHIQSEQLAQVPGDEDEDSESTLLEYDTTCETGFVQNHQNVSRNQPVQPPCVYSSQCYLQDQNILLKVRDTVELVNDSENYENDRKRDFLRIQYIIENCQTGEIILRGWRFRRNYFINNMLPKKLNEVCMVLNVDDNDPRPPLTQAMEDVSTKQVFKKRKLIMTNQNWPALSFREHTTFQTNGPNGAQHRRNIHNSEVLVSRWVLIANFATSEVRHQNKGIISGALRRLTQRESDPNHTRATVNPTVLDSALTREWLGYLPAPTLMHTFGDAFSGAGGFSEGAAQAGVKIIWAFDQDGNPCATYALNRPGTDVLNATADQFIAMVRGSNIYHVAILHISPPCQPYSPAHTQPGRLDAENTATICAVLELIKLLKPRVVTLEQTSGIVSHHPVWFRALVHMFTTVGYSVRWKVTNLDDLGVAQKRKRLIMFASCPGGVLPTFPAATHGRSSRRAYQTIADALAPLSTAANVTHHNAQGAVSRNLPPYSANTPLRGCITTGGSIDCHPSGTRAFTIRELALLQSLPVTFRFPEEHGVTTLRRQIGNMVPAVAAKALIEAVIKALDTEDNERSHESV